MKINIKKDEGKELDIEFEAPDLTVPDMIAKELLTNDSVEFAGVLKDHPEVGKPLLVIKSKKSPKSDLLKALSSIDENFADLKSQISKAKKGKQ
jgi:DNA-directed RNA polymerase subunit L